MHIYTISINRQSHKALQFGTKCTCNSQNSLAINLTVMGTIIPKLGCNLCDYLYSIIIIIITTTINYYCC